MPEWTFVFELDSLVADRLERMASDLGLSPAVLLARLVERAVDEHEQSGNAHRIAGIALRLYQGKRLGTEERRLAEKLHLRALVARVQAQREPVTLERLEAALRTQQLGG